MNKLIVSQLIENLSSYCKTIRPAQTYWCMKKYYSNIVGLLIEKKKTSSNASLINRILLRINNLISNGSCSGHGFSEMTHTIFDHIVCKLDSKNVFHHHHHHGVILIMFSNMGFINACRIFYPPIFSDSSHNYNRYWLLFMLRGWNFLC